MRPPDLNALQWVGVVAEQGVEVACAMNDTDDIDGIVGRVQVRLGSSALILANEAGKVVFDGRRPPFGDLSLGVLVDVVGDGQWC